MESSSTEGQNSRKVNIPDAIVSQVNKLNISGESKELLEESNTVQSDVDTTEDKTDPVATTACKGEESVEGDPKNLEIKTEQNDNQENYLSNITSRTEKFEDNNISNNVIASSECRNQVVNNLRTVAVNIPAHSAVILNKNSDSLRNLLAYESDDSGTPGSLSDDSEDDDMNKTSNNTNWEPRLATTAIETSDSESDSTVDGDSTDDFNEHDIDTCSDSESSVKLIGVTTLKKKNPSSKPEVRREEDLLPPVPDLSNLDINLETEEFLHMGHIAAIVDKLVTVEALPGVPAYDLDSYLFIEQEGTKKPLGVIFDVMGPVTSPLYCIRFNAVQDIQDLNIKKGTEVFVAPKSEYSKYVFVSQLMKMKGTDASWKNDQERPGELEDFSDDEKEQEAKRGAKRSSLKRRHGSLERHQQYERTMNHCNVLNTRVNNLLGGPSNTYSRGRGRTSRPTPHHPVNVFRHRHPTELHANIGPMLANNGPIYANTGPIHANAGPIATFDPSVPPPGFNTPLRIPHNMPVTVQFTQPDQLNNQYASMSAVPPHTQNFTGPLDSCNSWSSGPYGEQPMRFPSGPPQRPFRGRSSIQCIRFYPPGPSSNNF